VKFGLIEAEKANHDVGRLCRLLGVSRSGYYAWRRRPPSRRAASDKLLHDEIVQVHVEGRRLYGSPRIHKELQKRQRRVGRKRVARIMRENGLRARRQRSFRRSKSDAHFPYAANTLDRQFHVVNRPNDVWVGDGTYIRTAEGWLMLVVIIDLFSRKVVGTAMGSTMDGALATKAFKAACRHSGSAPRLFHSDRGAEYACATFRKAVEACGTERSMSRSGDCWDNAVAEAFFATLKKELVYLTKFSTRTAARAAVFEYIEVFYNRIRLHSTLGYRSPVEFEAAVG
jgi:putative transposase